MTFPTSPFNSLEDFQQWWADYLAGQGNSPTETTPDPQQPAIPGFPWFGWNPFLPGLPNTPGLPNIPGVEDPAQSLPPAPAWITNSNFNETTRNRTIPLRHNRGFETTPVTGRRDFSRLSRDLAEFRQPTNYFRWHSSPYAARFIPFDLLSDHTRTVRPYGDNPFRGGKYQPDYQPPLFQTLPDRDPYQSALNGFNRGMRAAPIYFPSPTQPLPQINAPSVAPQNPAPAPYPAPTPVARPEPPITNPTPVELSGPTVLDTGQTSATGGRTENYNPDIPFAPSANQPGDWHTNQAYTPDGQNRMDLANQFSQGNLGGNSLMGIMFSLKFLPT